MAFSLSPSVEIREFNFTQTVPSVATSIGSFAGPFQWGPIEDITSITDEDSLVKRFGFPDSTIAANWFSAKNFLDYGNFIRVVRVGDDSFRNSISELVVTETNVNVNTSAGVSTVQLTYANGSKVFVGMEVVGMVAAAAYSYNGVSTNKLYVAGVTHTGTSSTLVTLSAVTSTTNGSLGTVSFRTIPILIKNVADFEGVESAPRVNQAGVVAKFPGVMGNSLKVSCADAKTFATWAYRDVFTSGKKKIQSSMTRNWKFSATITHGSDVITDVVVSEGQIRDWAGNTNSATGVKFGNDFATGSASTGITSQINSNTWQLGAKTFWSGSTTGQTQTVEFSGTVSIVREIWSGAPGTSQFVDVRGGLEDEIFFVVIDEDGLFSGSKGTILESFAGLSKAVDAKNASQESIYFKDYLNSKSAYIWVTNELVLGWSGDSSTDFSGKSKSLTFSLSGGVADNSLITPQKRIVGYEMFSDPETVDVSLIVGGVVDSVLGDFIVDELVGKRRDCVGFISPPLSSVLGAADPAEGIISFRNEFNNSTYVVMDTGWKQQYDSYNDTFVWVPLNGDIAGLCANADAVRNPWTSPAGFNRGYVKNVVKLAYNPSKKADRDELYQLGVNPVVTFRGEGTVLYGDRTMTSEQTAFQQIGVRRLFIMVEKALATYAKFIHFEFNDEITRGGFVNTVSPYFREIQGQRGIYAYKVVADESVNTPQVIDSQGFVANLLLKPARSINFIQLNFAALKSGASFEEIEL